MICVADEARVRREWSRPLIQAQWRQHRSWGFDNMADQLTKAQRRCGVEKWWRRRLEVVTGIPVYISSLDIYSATAARWWPCQLLCHWWKRRNLTHDVLTVIIHSVTFKRQKCYWVIIWWIICQARLFSLHVMHSSGFVCCRQLYKTHAQLNLGPFSPTELTFKCTVHLAVHNFF